MMDFASITYLPDTKSNSASNLAISFTKLLTLSMEFKEILTDFIKDAEYISLAQFFDYWKLPSIKWAWNEWSLYSIINKYSQKYKTAVSSNYLHEAIPILVKMEYDVNKIDYSEIESQEMEEEQEDLLDVLDYDDLE